MSDKPFSPVFLFNFVPAPQPKVNPRNCHILRSCSIDTEAAIVLLGVLLAVL